MGRKEWPDEWKVGNDAARAGLGCIVIPIVLAVLAYVFSR